MTWAAGLRWSHSARAWMGFFTPLADGRIYCRHELTWLHKSPEFAAESIHEFCTDKHIRLDYIVGQPTIFPKMNETGETVSETFARSGLPMRKGSNDRIACWSRLRSWLEPRKWSDGVIAPALVIDPDCKRLIRTLPSLVQSPTKPDDVEEGTDEYPAMGVALYAMSRPSPWVKVEEKKPIHPLSGAYLWNELRNSGGDDDARYVGWNRHSAKIR